MKITAVIPAYNEERKIAGVIAGLKEYADEIVVVDDGSGDRTGEIAENSGATVIRHCLNRGQGAALETGNQYALARAADIIVHFDGDGQFSPADLTSVCRPIVRGEAEVVFGSRFLGQNAGLPWQKRYVLFPLAALVNRMILGVGLTDPQNGFRALSRRAAAVITIENDGAAHCSEIMAKVIRGGLSFREVPVTVEYDRLGQNIFHGRGRRTGGFRIIVDLLISRLIN